MAARPKMALWWIIVFKLVKAGALAALGIVLVVTWRVPAEAVVTEAAIALHLNLSSRLLQRVLLLAVSFTPRREVALGISAIAYASLFATEAMGLWRRALWARWLTVITTSCLVPLEVYEIVRRPTAVRVGALVVNVAVVVYLLLRRDIFEEA